MVDLCGPRVLDKGAVRQQEFRIHSGKKKGGDWQNKGKTNPNSELKEFDD